MRRYDRMSFFFTSGTIAAFSRERHCIKTQAARLSWRCVGFRLNIPSRAYPDAPPHGSVPRVRARSRHARARRSAPAPDAPRRPAAVRTRTVARLSSGVSSSRPRPARRDGGDTAGGDTGAGTTPRDLAPGDLPRGALRTRLAARSPLRHLSRLRRRARSPDLGPREKTVRAFGTPVLLQIARASETRARLSLPSDHTTDDRATDRRD